MGYKWNTLRGFQPSIAQKMIMKPHKAFWLQCSSCRKMMLVGIARISFQLKITKIVYICNCTWILMLSNVLIFQNIKGAGSSSTQNVCHLRILSLFHLLLQGWFLCCHYIQPNGEHNCFKAKTIAWPGKSWVLIPLLVRSNKSLSWRNQLAKNQTNHIHPQFNQKACKYPTDLYA